MSLAPALLVSMPQLTDPNFARTVVLLCEHGPEGALGLIVNRPAEVPAAEAVEFEPPIESPNHVPLHLGGPVEPERGWILTAHKPDVEHTDLGGGLYLAASPSLLRETLEASSIPRRTLVLAGYAGWSAGQLDAELSDSAWLIAPLDLDLIFEIPPAVTWEMAIRRMGADPSQLQMGHGVH
jgi:putative transcriptional regulator